MGGVYRRQEKKSQSFSDDRRPNVKDALQKRDDNEE